MNVLDQVKELITVATELKALREDFKGLASDVRDLRDRCDST